MNTGDGETWDGPKWTWDGVANAGYLDFHPGYTGRRVNTRPYRHGPVTFILDRTAAGDVVGIEVLV